MSKATQDFGRNEMAALFGGLPETEDANRPDFAAGNARPSAGAKEGSEVDFSNLTAAQTAALLKSKPHKKIEKTTVGRHRAAKAKTPQHIALANELLQKQQQENEEEEDVEDFRKKILGEQDDEDEEEDDFVIKKRQRVKAEPRIVMQPKVVQEPSRGRRRRHDSSSDSSSSDDESLQKRLPRRKQQQRKGRGGSSSSSSNDDDSSEDDRRTRLLANRRQHRRREDEEQAVSGNNHVKASLETRHRESLAEPKASESSVLKSTTKPKRDQSSSSSSSDGSSSDSSEDSSSSESEEEPIVAMAKPVFVPRHKRNAIKSSAQIEQEELQKQEEAEQLLQKQKLQSRTLVAKVVADANNGTANGIDESDDLDDDELKYGASMHPPPDDLDPTDPKEIEKERDAWEVRELSRLLQEVDRQETREKERLELERRRNMTDAEVLELDKAEGKYRRPGEERQKQTGKYLQRYYHRGAFYMDEDTLEQAGKDDVRHKAAEYAKAATAEDKVDKSKLPEVMQVKKFGFANQGSRYQGLAKEDTTDRSAPILPISRPRSKYSGRDGRRDHRDSHDNRNSSRRHG